MNDKEDKEAEQRTHNSKTVTMIGQHGAAKYDNQGTRQSSVHSYMEFPC